MEKNENPNYFAILPANVRYDKDLKPNAKLLYSEITSLCNEKGICWARNEYFAGLYDVSKETVSRWISQLKNKDYIKVVMFYKKNSKEIDKRIITINYNCPVDENVNTPYCQNNHYVDTDKNIMGYCQNNQKPVDENVKENNKILINNINNNIYSQVINYLNKKTSKNFKSNTKKTQSLIQARLKEGFTYEDFIRVIDTKTKEWKDDKYMSKFLRPETLFGTKFEGYLNEMATYNEKEQEQDLEIDDDLQEYKELSKKFGGKT